MITGIGLDVVDIDEWQTEVDASGPPWIERVFTAGEREHCRGQADPYRSFAGIFAAKEAALKALGKGWSDDTDWQDLEISHDDGRPILLLKGALHALAAQVSATKALVSITHTKYYAAAVVILER